MISVIIAFHSSTGITAELAETASLSVQSFLIGAATGQKMVINSGCCKRLSLLQCSLCCLRQRRDGFSLVSQERWRAGMPVSGRAQIRSCLGAEFPMSTGPYQGGEKCPGCSRRVLVPMCPCGDGPFVRGFCHGEFAVGERI